MAKLIKANGDVVDVKPKNEGQTFTAEELHDFVGGWIECVFFGDKKVMVVNEEGKLLGLPYNAIATGILSFDGHSDVIVGDAVLCDLGTEID